MTTKSMLFNECGGSASADVDAPADEVFALLTDTADCPSGTRWIRRADARASIAAILQAATETLSANPGAGFLRLLDTADSR
jgi:hypothetical protein